MSGFAEDFEGVCEVGQCSIFTIIRILTSALQLGCEVYLLFHLSDRHTCVHTKYTVGLHYLRGRKQWEVIWQKVLPVVECTWKQGGILWKGFPEMSWPFQIQKVLSGICNCRLSPLPHLPFLIAFIKWKLPSMSLLEICELSVIIQIGNVFLFKGREAGLPCNRINLCSQCSVSSFWR